MTTETIHSIAEKKLVRWGEGLVAFITPEAKRFGWNDKTRLKISAIKDAEGNAILIRETKG